MILVKLLYACGLAGLTWRSDWAWHEIAVLAVASRLFWSLMFP